jgi:hypothetical protein
MLPLALSTASLFGARLPLLFGLAGAVALVAGLAVAEMRREARREIRRETWRQRP